MAVPSPSRAPHAPGVNRTNSDDNRGHSDNRGHDDGSRTAAPAFRRPPAAWAAALRHMYDVGAGRQRRHRHGRFGQGSEQKSRRTYDGAEGHEA